MFTRKKSYMVRFDHSNQEIEGPRPKNALSLRMDNAAENASLNSNLWKEGLHIEVEFPSPNTPEQNGKVERGFATLWGRVRAI
jgi:hypothetical protein